MAQWIAGTVDENFKPVVSISGTGRVGSRAAAIRGGYSRSRKAWIVTYYDGTRSATGYERKTAELGPFKTGKLAAIAARDFAQGAGWQLDSYAQSFLKGGN